MAGILGQEALGRSPEWFNVGGQPQWLPDSALLAIEFFVIGHFEVKRYQGWNKHKTVRPLGRTTHSVFQITYVTTWVLGHERGGGRLGGCLVECAQGGMSRKPRCCHLLCASFVIKVHVASNLT